MLRNSHKWALTFLVPSLFMLIPLHGLYTENIRIFLIITLFVILLFAFELLDTLISSLMLPILYYFSGIVTIETALSSWTNTTIWMVVGALVLANGLEECKLLPRIALLCIRKCGGSFTGTLYGLYFTGIILAIISFCNAYMIMITLGYGICKAMKLKRSLAASLICCTALIGGSFTPSYLYSPAYCALGETGIRKIIPDFQVYWYQIYMYNGIQILLFLAFIWVLTKIFKTDKIEFIGGKKYFDREYEALGQFSLSEKKAVLLLSFIIILLLSSPLHNLSPAILFMTLPYTMFIPGINIASRKSLNINFGIIAFIASCLSIGVVGDAVGATRLVSESIAPLLAGTGAFTALLAILLLATVANFLLTPYAMMAVLSLPLVEIGLTLDINPLAVMSTLLTGTGMIFLPHEISGCLIMYSFGLMPMNDFIKINTLKVVFTLIFFIICLYPMWYILGLISI